MLSTSRYVGLRKGSQALKSGSVAHHWGKLQHVGLNSAEDVRLDDLMQLGHLDLVEIFELILQIFRIPDKSESASARRHYHVAKVEGQDDDGSVTYWKLGSSRKLSRLNSSRRLLFSGVPVINIRCTLLSCLRRLKIKLPSDFTE